MPDTIIQVVLRTSDAIPANFVTNQFCIQNMGNADGNEAGITSAIADFYDDIRNAIYSNVIAETGHVAKFYTAGGAAPNYPYSEETWDFTAAPGGTALPREVAVCLSFQGLRIPGTPQARRRGRIYLGPCQTGVVSNGRPLLAIRTTIVNAAQTFYTNVETVDPTYSWAVWSTRDATAVPLRNCWVDDAFDTQRSRGDAPTERTTKEFV